MSSYSNDKGGEELAWITIKKLKEIKNKSQKNKEEKQNSKQDESIKRRIDLHG